MNSFFFRFHKQNQARSFHLNPRQIPKINREVIHNYKNIKRQTNQLKENVRELSSILLDYKNNQNHHSKNIQDINLNNQFLQNTFNQSLSVIQKNIADLESEHEVYKQKILELDTIIPNLQDEIILLKNQVNLLSQKVGL